MEKSSSLFIPLIKIIKKMGKTSHPNNQRNRDIKYTPLDSSPFSPLESEPDSPPLHDDRHCDGSQDFQLYYDQPRSDIDLYDLFPTFIPSGFIRSSLF